MSRKTKRNEDDWHKLPNVLLWLLFGAIVMACLILVWFIMLLHAATQSTQIITVQ